MIDEYNVEVAETMFYAYDDAITSVSSAIHTLKDTRDPKAIELADALCDVLRELNDERTIHDDVLVEADRIEAMEMVREYWRSVI